jgi:glycosyltransferase involved in cell wall biosynthesis
VLYFHESQLTYPTRHADPRDVHFALTNMTSALAATAVWFNSEHHRDTFCDALGELLSNMPDTHCTQAAGHIRERAAVRPPGIGEDCFEPLGCENRRAGGPMRIVWAARWEHDKGPTEFFDAMTQLRASGEAFRLAVIGEQFRHAPSAFERARDELSDVIEAWGHRPTREEYLSTLGWADVFVSTAAHEFFGLAAVEAAACGALPLLPDRLAYPEVFGGVGRSGAPALFYGQSASDLSESLAELAGRDGWRSPADRRRRSEWARRYGWGVLARRYDDELAELAGH